MGTTKIGLDLVGYPLGPQCHRYQGCRWHCGCAGLQEPFSIFDCQNPFVEQQWCNFREKYSNVAEYSNRYELAMLGAIGAAFLLLHLHAFCSEYHWEIMHYCNFQIFEPHQHRFWHKVGAAGSAFPRGLHELVKTSVVGPTLFFWRHALKRFCLSECVKFRNQTTEWIMLCYRNWEAMFRSFHSWLNDTIPPNLQKLCHTLLKICTQKTQQCIKIQEHRPTGKKTGNRKQIQASVLPLRHLTEDIRRKLDKVLAMQKVAEKKSYDKEQHILWKCKAHAGWCTAYA